MKTPLLFLILGMVFAQARELDQSVVIAIPVQDANHDRKISSHEAFSGFRDYLQGKGDLDQNGAVTKEELRQRTKKSEVPPAFTVKFNDLDTNGDGQIDSSEIKAFSKNLSLISNTRDVTGYGGDSRSKVMDSANDIGLRIRF